MHWHGAGIDNEVTGADEFIVFEDLHAIFDRIVGRRETVVEKALHAPEQVERIEHAGVVAENEDFGFGPEAADFKSGVA